PYAHVLKSGKTLIQHIYDSHFEGYEEAEAFAAAWDGLQGKVEERVFENVKERFGRQLYNAREWRDQVNSYFYRKSGIPDEKGREIF
ncbi:MAG: alpha-glucuronidase, partial [Lachnospiraceae bacterium]|nr:alpha-glucuronidase [Lachnospiraceae bacterium]